MKRLVLMLQDEEGNVINVIETDVQKAARYVERMRKKEGDAGALMTLLGMIEQPLHMFTRAIVACVLATGEEIKRGDAKKWSENQRKRRRA